MRLARVPPVVAAAICIAAVVGCFGGSSDRLGGSRPAKRVVLTLAGHDNDPALKDWADAVQRRSHGLVRISLQTDWRGRQVAYEQGTVSDVRTGKLDLAAVPARAFDMLGVNSFQAILAPFEVDSYALERKLLADGLPDRLLGGVNQLGVTGVALLPGPMEKLLSISSVLLEPSDLAVLRLPVGVDRSRLAAATFRALGAGTTDLATKGDVYRFAAMAEDVVEVVANHHHLVTAGESMPANLNLWPRITTVVMNDKAYAALTREQRGALSAAAREAVGTSWARITRHERAALAAICKPGSFFFLTASAADRAALRRAVAPVYDEIGRDAVTREALASIDEARKQVNREPAPTCPHRPAARAASAKSLRVSGALHKTAGGSWVGAIASPRFGRGTLSLLTGAGGRPHIGPSVNAGLPVFVTRFRDGELRGCILATIAPHTGFFRWDGPGVIQRATGRLRPYAHQSLRLRGVTTTRDPHRMRGGFTTDIPSGMPCDGRQGI